MSIEADGRPGVAAPAKYVGRWHLADRPDVVAHGELTVPERTGLLTLSDSLTQDGVVAPIDGLIFGVRDDGTKVTLVGAWLQSAKTTHRGDGSARRETWGSTSAYVGEWLADGRLTRFKRASITSHRLMDWAAAPADIDHEAHPRATVIRVQTPASRSARIDDVGHVDLHWNESSSYGDLHSSVRVSPYVEMSFDEPIEVEAVWSNFVIPIVHWLVLATGRPDRLVTFRLWPDVEGEASEGWHPGTHPYVDSLTFAWRTEDPDGDKPVARWFQWIPLNHKSMSFENAMPRWFRLHARFHRALLRFFSEAMDPAQFAEESFERIVRALEVWSSVDDVSGAMSEEAYGDLLAKLKESFPGQRDFLESRLKYANSKSLKQRLDALLAEAAEPISEAVATKKQFSRRTVETRNSLVHRGDKGDSFTYHEMFEAERIWQLVLFSILLRRLGAESSEVREIIEKSDQWGFV